MSLPAPLANLPNDRKRQLRNRAAVASARMGIGLGDQPTPGALALALRPRTVVQRAHLELIDEACRRVLAGEVNRVLITTPPQVGKSERAAVWFPFWWLTHRPRDRILLTSYADSLAVKRGRDVRDLVREFGMPYGLEVRPDVEAAGDWELTSGGGMRSTGIRGSYTGRACDLGVIDDPHKNREEADNPELLEKIEESYSADFVSRLAPGAPVFIIQTRWARQDLAGRRLKLEGRLEDGGRFLVIHIPAIADSKFGPDPLGRAPGEPCPHPRIPAGDVPALTAYWAEKRSSSRARDWAALYQGDPVDAVGALTTEAILERQTVRDPQVEQIRTAVAIDPSGDGRDAAGIVAGYLDERRHCHWTHDRSGEMGVAEWSRAACELAVEVDADVIVYESNYGKGMAKFAIRTAWDALRREWHEDNPLPADATDDEREQHAARCPYADNRMPRLVEQVSRKGKLLRADPVAQALAEGRQWLDDHLPELCAEWLDWTPGSRYSPGRIDASVHLTLYLLRPPGSETVISNPTGRGPSGASPIHRRRTR